MSRLSDLLNPVPTASPPSPPTKNISSTTRASSHARNQSITSPLEALAIAATTAFSAPSLTHTSSSSPIYSDFRPPQYDPIAPQQLNYGPSSPPQLSHLATNHAHQQISDESVGQRLTNQHAPAINLAQNQLGLQEAAQNDVVSSGQLANGPSEASKTILETKSQSGVSTLPLAIIKQEQKSPAHETPYQPNNISGPGEGISDSISEAVNQTVGAIKKEESQGPTIADLPSKAASPAMAAGNESKARATPKADRRKPGMGIAKKTAPKKRKIEVDSRGDTPISQRSGTPNSIRAKNAPKNKKQNSATPAQSSPPPVDDEGEEEEEEGSDDEVFCICRKPDDHTWMIACDGGCDDWFHGRCVNMDQRDGNLIDKYICPNCSAAKDTHTLWKPMCRLEGCREPARITGTNPSKYCCDDHGIQYMRRLVSSRSSKEPLETSARKRRKDHHTDHLDNNDEENSKQSAHLRGGIVSSRELHALTCSMQHGKNFKDLGDTIPRLENGVKIENRLGSKDECPQPAYSPTETEQLGELSTRRKRLQNKLSALEDRERFLAMVRTRAKSTLEELKKRDKSYKDICGFDKRLRWDESDFDEWRSSSEGIENLKSGKLGPPLDPKEKVTDIDGDTRMVDSVDELGRGICQKKRCKQHEGWYKLHAQDFAFEKSDRRRELHKLESEEKGVQERAMIRELESHDEKKVNGEV